MTRLTDSLEVPVLHQMPDHRYFANLIWQIADLLRGPYRPPRYERVMLSMMVLRCGADEGTEGVAGGYLAYMTRLPRDAAIATVSQPDICV